MTDDYFYDLLNVCDKEGVRALVFVIRQNKETLEMSPGTYTNISDLNSKTYGEIPMPLKDYLVNKIKESVDAFAEEQK